MVDLIVIKILQKLFKKKKSYKKKYQLIKKTLTLLIKKIKFYKKKKKSL